MPSSHKQNSNAICITEKSEGVSPIVVGEKDKKLASKSSIPADMDFNYEEKMGPEFEKGFTQIVQKNILKYKLPTDKPVYYSSGNWRGINFEFLTCPNDFICSEEKKESDLNQVRILVILPGEPLYKNEKSGKNACVVRKFKDLQTKEEGIVKTITIDPTKVEALEESKYINPKNEQHINVKLNKSYTKELIKSKTQSHMFLRPEKGVSLDKLLKRTNLPEAIRLTIAKKMLETVRNLHKRGILHRDLKPEHFFVDIIPDQNSEGGYKVNVSIIDFGYSVMVKQGEPLEWKGEFCGTNGYIAPEIAINEKNPAFYRKCQYNEKTDIYALGKTFLRLFVPRELARNNSVDDIKNEDIKKLVKKMLNPEVEQRSIVQDAIDALEKIEVDKMSQKSLTHTLIQFETFKKKPRQKVRKESKWDAFLETCCGFSVCKKFLEIFCGALIGLLIGFVLAVPLTFLGAFTWTGIVFGGSVFAGGVTGGVLGNNSNKIRDFYDKNKYWIWLGVAITVVILLSFGVGAFIPGAALVLAGLAKACLVIGTFLGAATPSIATGIGYFVCLFAYPLACGIARRIKSLGKWVWNKCTNKSSSQVESASPIAEAKIVVSTEKKSGHPLIAKGSTTHIFKPLIGNDPHFDSDNSQQHKKVSGGLTSFTPTIVVPLSQQLTPTPTITVNPGNQDGAPQTPNLQTLKSKQGSSLDV